MRVYDYSFLKSMSVPVNFLRLTNSIYALRTVEEEKKADFPDIFTNLQRIAVVQSVKGSNAIEGILATDKRIEEIVNQNADPLNHSEQEILGYKEALAVVHENFGTLPFNVDGIKYLYSILLGHTDLTYRGDFKKEDNAIWEKYPDGTACVRFRTVPAAETEESMENLVLAYMAARDDSEINQLLLIPCVILDFLCIHPFQDGNGRMSRLLSLLLMYKSGFDISKYISFEEQINKSKENYYEALRRSSLNWHEGRNDYIPFMENFLFTLYLCYKELDKRFLTLRSGKISKTKRVEETVLSAFLPVSKKEISNLLPDISVTTIESVLAAMVKSGKIGKIGTTKNAKYFKK